VFTESLSQFFDVADFGETVTRSNATTFSAIFDLEYVDPLDVSSRGPAITAQASVALVRDEVLTIRSVQYQVRVIELDGTGVVVGRLSRV
jgi:hypothetical protein